MEFKTQLSTFPQSQIGIYFLLSEGFLGLRMGDLLQMALGFERNFCQEISSQTCPTIRAHGGKEAEGGSLLRKEGKTIIFIRSISHVLVGGKLQA